MVNPTRGRFNFVAVYLRHARACLAVYWTLTLALAAFALGGFLHSTPGTSTPSVNTQARQAACTDGKILVHFVKSGTTANTGSAECILVTFPSTPSPLDSW
ncbi:MAG: hypothetical protein ACRDG4_14440 [Chloroflexota bacterium]